MLLKISPEEIKSIGKQMPWKNTAYERAIIICFYKNLEIGKFGRGINIVGNVAINNFQELCCVDIRIIQRDDSPWFYQTRYYKEGVPFVA